MKKVMVETSARHVHVNVDDLATLFGEGYELHAKKNLSQPGEFASDERVTVAGPKGELPNVSILGPTRGKTQVEISLTDARHIGVKAPVRVSGDIAGSAAVTLKGPNGTVELSEGCIAAKRHVHLDTLTAEKFGVVDKQVVKVACGANGRDVLFCDVIARVSDKFAAAVHLDTDEANAAGGPAEGEIITD